MKLLIIGSDYVWSIERYYLKYIKELNPDTLLFPAQNRKLDHLNRSLWNKAVHRLGLSSVYKKINRELLALIESYNPNWILVFKGMEVLPETLKKAKQKGINLANYNPDNPFIFTGRGSGNTYIRQSLGIYDLHFTYNLEIQKQISETTGKPVVFLPFGFDLGNFDLKEIQSLPEINKPCFLGNPDPDRASFIKALNKKGIGLDIYGNNWSKYVSSKENSIFDAVYGIDFYKVLYRYRLQLNILRVHNLQSHNMRTFEIPAIGGIQLAPDTPEHRLFFEPEKDLFLYVSLDDCVTKIKKILSLSKEDANKIRQSSKEKVSSSGYDYNSLALFVYNTLKSFSPLH